MKEFLKFDGVHGTGGPHESSMIPLDPAAIEPNPIDQNLRTSFEAGPSSLIDQEVIGALNRLKDRQDQPAAWQLILNPIAAFNTLQAFWGETDAYANARSAIARSVQTQVKWGAEDLQRDTILSYMSSLKTALGPMLPEFCSQHGLAVPPEKSIAEMIQLLRLNHAIVSVAKYQTELSLQMEKVIAERTRNEAALTISNHRAEMLPSLIESEKRSLPLQRKMAYQRTAHGFSLLGGVPTAAVTGLVSGILGGFAVGAYAGIEWAGKQLKKAGAGIDAGARGIKAWFTSSPEQ